MRAAIAGSGPLLAALLACAAWAQPAGPSARDGQAESKPSASKPAESGAAKATVEASELDTFLLRDSKGNLVPVLGMPFEEFERLLKIKRGLEPPAPPDYSLDALAITGSADEEVATLQVVATIRVREADWVRIPLRMNQAVLKDTVEHVGGGEFFITCEADGDGYLCWIKAGPPADKEVQGQPAGDSHQIKLRFAVPLRAIGDERRLAMTLPRATESSLKLDVPLKADATLRSGGDGLLSTRSLTGGRSEISLLGAAGELEISWRPSRETPTAGNSLEAVGDVLVKVEGETRITSEAKLRVRNHAGPLETFQVRLPPGMELSPSTATGYSIAPVNAPTGSRGEKSQLVEVKLDRPASGPVDVRIAAALASRLPSSSAVEPVSWEVLGAARQRGAADVVVAGDWLLRWTEGSNVRRIDTPADSPLGTLAARFEYFRQPCNLKLQVSPRPTRISVEPTYVIYVDADQTRLEAILNYRVRGTRAQSIRVEAAGWKLDRVSPDAYFASDAADATDGDSWQMALASDAPSEMDVTFEAQQPSPKSDSLLQFVLPKPQADLTTPATVVVVPGDNVELIPDATETRGLTVDSLPSKLMLPPRQQSPLVYRDLGGVERAQFAARFRLRERVTAVSTDTSVQLDRRRMQVTQKLRYRIAHEPKRVFELAIPAELQRASGLSVAFEDKVLSLEPVDAELAQPAASAYRFVAPRDLIGPCEFTVKYALPTPALPAGETATISLPLPMPVDRDESEFTNHSLAVRYADDLKLDSVEPPADARSGPAEFDGSLVQLALLHPVSHVDLGAAAIETQESAAVAIQRAWLQTWLTGESRQDRAVWRMTSREPTIRLQLPAGSQMAQVQVALNGHPVERTTREKDILGISIPAGMVGKEQVLEVWYSIDRDELGWGLSHQRLDPPTIVGGSSVQRLYWQLCLPPQEHLLVEPTGFAAELGWKWRGIFWERQGTVAQDELEQWTGASQQPPLPESVNTYLFSSFGSTPPLQVAKASQRLLLAMFSLGALLVGLALVYIQRLRTPLMLLVVSALLIVAALWAPEVTLFVGQAIVLGLVVALISAFGWWLTTGRLDRGGEQPSGPGSSPTTESRSTQMPTPPLDRASPSTTATSPLGIAAVESRP